MANKKSLTQTICNLSPYLQKLVLLSIITMLSQQICMAASVNLVEIDTITIENPMFLALTPDGNKLYAVTYPNKINVIDTLTKQVVTSIPLSGGSPFQIAITPDGRYAYLAVSNASGDSASGSPNRVEVIDVSTDTIATTIPISGSPYGPIGTAITPSGSEVYVTVRGSNKVDVIDAATNTVAHSITVGDTPIAVAITSDGNRAYVVSRSNSTVSVIDTSTKTVVATIPLSIGPNTSSNRIALDTNYAYVTYIGFGDIAVIDINPTSSSFHQQIGIIPTSGINLRGIAIDSQGNKMALVASYDTNELLVIDTDPNSSTFHSQIGTVPIGSGPVDVVSQSLPIAIAYVSNYGSNDNTISVIDYPTELPITPPPIPLSPTTPPLVPLPPTMKLTVGFIGNGHGHVTTDPSGIDCDSNQNQTQCSHSFDTATWVNLITTPAADSRFIRWVGNRHDCEDGELFMTEPSACVADFRLLRFPLTITITGQGQVSSDPIGIHCSDQCQSLFDIGTNITLTAVPEKGWQFQEWRGDCDKTGTVVIKTNQACQATFVQLPSDLPPIDNAILTACANAIPWDGQTNEKAVVKNTGTLNLSGSLTPIKIKALCNYGTIQEVAGKLLSIRVNPRVGFIYNEGNILGKDGNSSTAKSTIPTHLVNEGDNGSSIKLKAGTQLYNQGLIQAGAGGNGYFTAGQGGSVEIYADQIIQAGTISAGKGGEGNAHQPEWDGVWESETSYGNQPVWGGQGGKTLLHAKQSLHAIAMAMTSSGTGGNAYVWCRNGAHLIDWWFDGRWYAGTCVSNNSNLPVAIPTPGKGGDLIQLSPALYDLSQASSGKGLYYEPSTITLSTETRLQAQEDILIFGGDDWVLDLRHLSVGAISTLGNITLAVGKDGIIDLRGNTGKIFQAGGQVTVFTDTLWLDEGISLADLVAAPEGFVTHPSKIIYQVILNGPEQIIGEPQTTLPIELELINGGPEADAYYLTVSDSAGWNLSALPSPISVAGLKYETLRLNITLPAMAGEQDTITVTAISVAEPTVTSTTQIVVKVASESSSSATTTVVVNQPPITIENGVAASNSEPVADSLVELPPVTESDSSTIPVIEPFSSLPPSTPPCYASGLIDWVCNANGQQLTDLTVGPNGMIAYGTLVGTLINQGWVSNLTLESNSYLTGGIVTGYIINHGEMANFEFRGAAIVGGMLAGKVTNTSQIDGYFRDVQLAAGTHLIDGNLQGNISGDFSAPALLEKVTIKSGSFIAGVKLGDGVIVEDNVTCGDNVQAPAGVCQATLSSEPERQNFPDLGATASNKKGETVPNHAAIRGGIAVNSGAFESLATVSLADEVTIQGQIQVDPAQVGQAGEVVVYVEYTPLGANEPVYVMLNESGKPVKWDNNLAHLASFQVIPKLAELIDVLMYQGKLPVTGALKIGLGYRLADGLVVRNLEPIEVNISQ
jgi:YVTN family beta-propeller protein